MKRLFKKLLLKIYKKKWDNNKKFKLLIHLNQYFTEKKWLYTLKKKLEEYDDIEIIFAKNKYELLNLIYKADFCFLWNLSNHIKLEKTNIKFIYFGSSGLEYLNQKKIPDNVVIENVNGISAPAIAEYTLAMILLIKRKINIAFENKLKKVWNQEPLLKKQYIPINKNKIGIFGLGNNGLLIAEKLKKVGFTVYALDVMKKKCNNIDSFFLFKDLKLFLNDIDFLILSCPLNSETEKIINNKTISLMKNGASIINISRGKVIDEAALLKALKKRKLQYAALDVFSKEPLPKTNKFWNNSHVIITPHISGNVNLFINDIQTDFCGKVNAFIDKNS